MTVVLQSFVDRVMQYAWRLTLGHGTLIFLGYAIPIWFSKGSMTPNPIREIIIATRIVIDAVIAFVSFDLGKFIGALMRPGTLEPELFAFGRWGLAMAVAGLILLLIVDTVGFGVSAHQQVKAWRVTRRVRKTVEEQKQLGDARPAAEDETNKALDGKPRTPDRPKFDT